MFEKPTAAGGEAEARIAVPSNSPSPGPVATTSAAIAIRPLAYVSFTFDHRILDGASADGFVGTIKNVIENYQ